MNCREPVIFEMNIAIPEHVSEIAEMLTESGHEAYVVGGAVRDYLIGKTPTDWDIASSATPGEVKRIFGDRAIPTGERFGTLTVFPGGRQGVEVTTFREEGRYSDGRRPDRVVFSESLRDDVARRDFTINALAYDILQKSVTDYFGGIDDLRDGIIRTVGDPKERFSEDSLRMLRAIRFAVELGFEISPETLDGITELHSAIRRVSPERIQDELSRMLLSARPGKALRYAHETHLLDHILPELSDCAHIPAHHESPDTLLEHSIRACESIEPRLELRLAALLHDIGKPVTMEQDDTGRLRFFSHESVGAELAKAALERLKYPGALINRVITLIKWHMFTYEPATKDKGIRRLVNLLGLEAIYDLAKVRQADRVALGLEPNPGSNMEAFLRRLEDVLRQGPAFTVNDLAVDGRDVMRILDIPEGPEVGRVLAELLEMVLEEPGLNSRERLLDIVKTMADNKMQ
ncbi:MAG: HD domain-containing protein [Firmicutes bacterium]|jgi:putative nucleotidyltransferase with HDIG domain|nr:HD domain-containing protein [Bacillota bacterium]